jgi:hypothetical protein
VVEVHLFAADAGALGHGALDDVARDAGLFSFSIAAKSRALPSGSPPPSLAATEISFTSLPTVWPFFRLTIARFA